MVYFGTGKFFEVGDNIIPATPQVNTFYAIRDTDNAVSGRGELQAQTIDYELYDQTFGTNVFDNRVVSDNSVDYTTRKGWYLDLVSPVNGAEGERVVVQPLLRNGRMIFSTLIPAVDPCGFGGTGWLMEIDAISGARFSFSVFDLDGDGLFDGGDYVTLPDGTTVPVSGQRFNEIISQPVVIDAGEKEYKYISGSSGNIQTVTEKGDFTKGRQSWRQIR
jgi:type IV pilus assembly protein PilY1